MKDETVESLKEEMEKIVDEEGHRLALVQHFEEMIGIPKGYIDITFQKEPPEIEEATIRPWHAAHAHMHEVMELMLFAMDAEALFRGYVKSKISSMLGMDIQSLLDTITEEMDKDGDN